MRFCDLADSELWEPCCLDALGALRDLGYGFWARVSLTGPSTGANPVETGRFCRELGNDGTAPLVVAAK